MQFQEQEQERDISGREGFLLLGGVVCVHVAVKMDVCTNMLEGLHCFCLNIFIFYAGAKHLLSPAAVGSIFCACSCQ